MEWHLVQDQTTHSQDHSKSTRTNQQEARSNESSSQEHHQPKQESPRIHPVSTGQYLYNEKLAGQKPEGYA